jgi:flagellar hook protein FlgE
MSINSAMNAGVSGLLANSQALSAISDNIANVNTVGYKTSDTTFESLVSNQGANGAPQAGGVIEQTTQLVTQQGLTTQTSSPTDLSINGSGFFVTTTEPSTIGGANTTAFTRAGSFTTDSQGYLQNTAGLYLQGWPVDANGDPISSESTSALQPINVTSLSSAPGPTTAVSVTANLKSTQATSAAASTYSQYTEPMSTYDAATGTGVAPDYSIQIPVSDSQGGQRTLQLDFLKSSTPNTWNVEVVAVPASDVTNGGLNGTSTAGLAAGQITAGTIAFTPSGAIDPANSTLFGSGATSADLTLVLGASSAATPAAGSTTANWSSSLGIAAQSITLNLNDLSQYASASATTTINTNGTPFGSLSSVSINAGGNVTALFSNGISRTIAQVAIATFPNPDGLTAISGDAYQTSQTSGAYTLDTPGTGSAGLLDPSTLEASTVNLSSQFSDLITTQQAYSASSKIITTADQMLQELINIIQ